jgi:hypothetical protein
MNVAHVLVEFLKLGKKTIEISAKTPSLFSSTPLDLS